MLMNFCNSKECITLKLLKVDESTWINPDNMVKYSTNFLNSWADKSVEILENYIEENGIEEFTNIDLENLYNESEETIMKEILTSLKGLTQQQGEKILEEKGYIIDDSFSEKCANFSNRYLSDTYYRQKYGNHEEWFCYVAEYIPGEDYEDESEFIRGYWTCNTKEDITISELEL